MKGLKFPFLKKNFAIAFVLANTTISCKKESAPAEKVDFTISASANAAQEVPVGTSPGTGTATGTYNKTTNLLTYTIMWTGLTGAATNMHFHGPAAAGANASVTLPITGFASAASGTLSATATLNDAQEIDMMAGNWYYNVHTAAKPGGEIRGQVTVQ